MKAYRVAHWVLWEGMQEDRFALTFERAARLGADMAEAKGLSTFGAALDALKADAEVHHHAGSREWIEIEEIDIDETEA